MTMRLTRLSLALLAAASLVGCADDRLFVVTDTCAVDTPAKESVIKLGTEWHIGGWAYDRSSGTVPKSISVQLLSADLAVVRTLPASRGTRREDVAKAFGLPAVADSGFDVRATLNGIPEGRYMIQVVQSDERKVLLCSNAHFVMVRA